MNGRTGQKMHLTMNEDRRAAANKKYMSIAVSLVRERQSSASALVVRGQVNSRNSATAYISER